MKDFLYKYAEHIFWIVVILNALDILTGNYIRATNTVLLIIPYLVFKKYPKDRWFLTYYWSFVLYGLSYFLIQTILSGNLLTGIVQAIVFGALTILGYYYGYKKRAKKELAWFLYFVAMLVALYSARFV